MWQLKNSTRYKANRAWVRDMDGREVWLVALRARFLIDAGGKLMLQEAKLQPEVKLAPEFASVAGHMMLLADSDLPHFKQATDVLVQGHACAPEGHMAERLLVSVRVGPVQKSLAVFGDRTWRNGAPSAPRPFNRIPVDWTRAYGGVDAANPSSWLEDNPVCMGFSTKADALNGRPVPNIEDPRALITSFRDRPRPAGFGPIAGHWPQRLRYAGTYDKRWEETRLPLLPLDFNPRFHQQAPEDQQVQGFLHGGETVVVEGMHPSGTLRFELPRVSLALETEFDDRALTEIQHEAKLHTVVLEPDLPAVSLVWHSHLECHSKVNLLYETRIWERARIRVPAAVGAGR